MCRTSMPARRSNRRLFLFSQSKIAVEGSRSQERPSGFAIATEPTICDTSQSSTMSTCSILCPCFSYPSPINLGLSFFKGPFYDFKAKPKGQPKPVWGSNPQLLRIRSLGLGVDHQGPALAAHHHDPVVDGHRLKAPMCGAGVSEMDPCRMLSQKRNAEMTPGLRVPKATPLSRGDPAFKPDTTCGSLQV